jgi:NADPH:quinone reductase-like Zn-dependent oxidoreductase
LEHGGETGRRYRVPVETPRAPGSGELIESGKVVPAIDRTYPLTETAAAIRHLQDGRARGKVVIAV